METLERLAGQIEGAALFGKKDIVPLGVAYDSRRVQPGDLFVCWRGERFDGHAFAAEAVAKGAVALLCERYLPQLEHVPQIVVPNSRAAMGKIAAALYGHPSARLRLIGVTGTNGKTTSTYLIKAIMEAAGHRVGLIGTIQHLIADQPVRAARTTPEAPEIQNLLATMVDRGCSVCVMEVSSHGIDLQRIAGCRFAHGLFTNLTHDHLDYHGTFEAYRDTKVRFFRMLHEGAVINLDDPSAAHFRAAAEGLPIIGYGIERSDADVSARNVRVEPSGTTYVADTPLGSIHVSLRLTGEFNVYNSLGAIGVAIQAGVPKEAIAAGLTEVRVPGRFERIDCGQPFTVIVDYAHTPDGLANVLRTARQLAKGRVIAVFGAGGDRDRSKRPRMGQVGAAWADWLIITSDNPRSEDPFVICEEIRLGVKAAGFPLERAPIIVDRRRAIREAIAMAKDGDLILIAGKGHETYQEFHDRVIPFDDRAEAVRALEERFGSAQVFSG